MSQSQTEALAAIHNPSPIRPKASETIARAKAHLQAGELDAAEALYRAIPADDAAFVISLHHLGLIAWQRGNRPEAADFIEQSLRRKADDAQAWSNLGVVLLGLERPHDAVEACRRALALDPTQAAGWSNLGNGLKTLGRLEEAISAYRAALDRQPDFPGALVNLADGLVKTERWNEALAMARKAADLAPDLTEAHVLIAHVLRHQKDFAGAAVAFRAALTRRPNWAGVWVDLGATYLASGLFDQAFDAFETALTVNPASADAHCGRAGWFIAKGRMEEAVAACRAALAIEPRFSEAEANLAAALRQLQRFDEALAAARRALALNADLVELAIEICDLRHILCDWDGLAAAARDAIARCAARGRPVPPFPLLNFTDTPADHARFARTWALGLRPAVPPKAPRLVPYARLRVGYLSSDLHSHATATLMAGVFESHDREGFEIFAYSCGPDDGSTMRRRLEGAFDHWVELRDVSHEASAARIRADNIQILVDLKGYTRDARPAILALRPAPIQVAFLGYPGPMGADFIDYALIDAVVVPPGQHDVYDEKLVSLPHCYQPNDRRRRIAETRPDRAACGLPEHGFVFCCFNAAHKITPTMFAIWMKVLAETAGSVLWLLEPHATAKKNLRREAAAAGIDPDRLVFAAWLPLEAHLARLGLADLFLDTLPYNAHTTASEVLWAGVPVLTVVGQAFAGRVGASLLRAVGLPELVATSLEDYTAAALFLARSPEVLAGLRQRLAVNRETAPLFDTLRSTRALEAAYRRMVAIHVAGQEPISFSVFEPDGGTN